MPDNTAQKMMLYPQSEVGYTDYAVRRNPVNAVCQTCRWFSKARLTEDGTVEHFCHLVESYPLDIVPTGYCDKWAERPAPETDTQETEVVTVNDDETEIETMAAPAEDEELIPLPLRAELSDEMARRTLGKYAPAAVLEKARAVAEVYTVKAFGDGLWVAAFSNNFKDRQGEIITAQAFDRYLSRVQRGVVPMPELWVWHTPGTRAGKAMMVDRAGHIVYAVGKFDDTPQGRELEAAMKAAKPGEFTLSHGFNYPAWAFKDGMYEDVNVFEISLLPAGAEANPYTAITAIREEMKMLSDEKKTFFGKVFGVRAPEVIALAENFENAGKAIAADGVQYKEYADYTEPVETGEKAAEVEAGYKDLMYEVMQSQGVVLNETNVMQKALNKALTRIGELESIIKEGYTKAGQGTPLVDSDTTAKAAEFVGKKQTATPEGLEALFPGMFNK